MERILYLECSAGISGDMFVASLLDLGVDEEYLRENLKTLPLKGYDIKISRVQKMSLNACDFNVVLEDDNHDHDMEYLHHDKKIKQQHHHEHRHLNDIIDIINKSKITDNAKNIAIKIFNIIATAEAKAHGIDIQQVHFHEVGAIDSIVDIVSASICFDKLQIDKVVCTNLAEGTGFIRCQHGQIPIPVPAVVNIAIEHKLNLSILDVKGELITPTGAGIVAGIKTTNLLPKSFIIEKVGIGAGKRQYDILNILRAMIIKA